MAKLCRYHWPSSTRSHAEPPKTETQSVGGSDAVDAGPLAEDVALAGRRAASRRDGLLEPRMQIRRVVGDDVDDDPDAAGVQRVDHPVEVVERSQPRVDVAVVGDVVPAIGQRGRVERAQPHRVHAEVRQVIDARHDAGEVAQAVAVRIGEAARIHLVHDGLAPPGSGDGVGGG